MRVSVDNTRCSGHALCAAAAPDLFGLDESGYSDICQGREVPSGLEEAARRGVASCPESALRLEP